MRTGKTFATFVFGLLLAAFPSSARAADVPIDGERHVEVHGFVSPGFFVTTGNNYLAKSKRGSFEFTEVGINFTVPVTENLRTGMQLFARDLGPLGNYSPKLDWFYLDYRFDDWLGIRAGRVKIPFGLYNDIADIDAARVSVLLPQSVYSVVSRDFLLAQTGGEIYGRVRAKGLGAFEYRLYGGTIFLDPAAVTSVTTPVTGVDVPFVAGQRLMWETPLDGLRFAGSFEALSLDFDFILPPGLPYPAGPASIHLPAHLWLGSAEYAADRLLLAAEYGRQTVLFESSIPAVNGRVVSERGYVMAAYRLTDWFHPGAYYSALFPDVEHRSGREHVQHDLAGTLRFDINRHWLVKLEGHFMSGTAGLDRTLNDGKPLQTLEKNWGAFFVKTTVYF